MVSTFPTSSAKETSVSSNKNGVKATFAATVAALLGLLIGALTSCSTSNSSCYTLPDSDECSPAQVNKIYPAADAVQARIFNELHQDDGIIVNIGGEMPVSNNNITIVSDETRLFIVSEDHWLPQQAADTMAVEALGTPTDWLGHVVALIDKIHAWQAANPRLSHWTTTQAPAAQHQPASYNWRFAWIILWIFVGVMVYAGFLSATGHATGVYQKRRCSGCHRNELCEDHRVAQFICAALWPIAIPAFIIYWLLTTVTDTVMRREHTTRRQQKLLETQNRQAELQITYNQSLAILKEAGVNVDGIVQPGLLGVIDD